MAAPATASCFGRIKFLSFGFRLYCLLFCVLASGASDVSRTYTYKGFDTNGNLLVEGILTLRVNGTSKVRGDWEFRVLDQNKLKEIGPQDGSGKILGQFNGDRIFLNLNPGVFGDNIYLDGKVSSWDIFKINGKWARYGYYAGKLNEGNFEMTRKKAPPAKSSPFRHIAVPGKAPARSEK